MFNVRAMHDNLCMSKNEELPGLLRHGRWSDEDDPRLDVVFTACRKEQV